MRVVVDANVAAAALIRPGGWTAIQLLRTDVEWWAPEFLLDELREREKEHAARAGCDLAEWRRRVRTLRERLRFVSDGEMVRAGQHAAVRKAGRVDWDDRAYLAAAVVLEATWIWSRDRRLKEAFPDIVVDPVPEPAT